MKKRLRFVTTLVAASLLAELFWTVSFAQSNNWLRAGDSDFESGSTAWKAFGAGTAEVTDNPSGSGKVLKFSGAEGNRGRRRRWIFAVSFRPTLKRLQKSK
ncbi:MAG: hypothetical protein V8S08_01905 [Lachnoclostridium sp.]